MAAVAAASAAAPEVANSTVSVAPKNPFFRRSFPVKAAASGSAVGMIASSSAKPQTQLPVAVLPKQTMEEYKTMLTKLIAWKRWKMAYYYLYSTKYTAYVASMPAEVSPEMATMKTYLSKSAIFFDILANYEITGFVWCSLLYTWTDPPPTDYMGAVLYYHSIKTAYSFFTWQWFLLMKDYFALFPDACALPRCTLCPWPKTLADASRRVSHAEGIHGSPPPSPHLTALPCSPAQLFHSPHDSSVSAPTNPIAHHAMLTLLPRANRSQVFEGRPEIQVVCHRRGGVFVLERVQLVGDWQVHGHRRAARRDVGPVEGQAVLVLLGYLVHQDGQRTHFPQPSHRPLPLPAALTVPCRADAAPSNRLRSRCW